MVTSSEIKVTQAYIGLFGRAPDPDGLAYWAAQLDAEIAAGKDADVALKELTAGMTANTEWTEDGLGATGTTDATVINTMYSNLFGRTPSTDERNYWLQDIEDNGTTASQMVVQLVKGAGAVDSEVLDYKQEAATYYASTVDQDDFDRTSAGSAVSSVDGPRSLQDSKDATDALVSGEGNTIALTTGNDTADMTLGDDTVTGTVGDGATYGSSGTNIDTISDGSTADSDTLTISGDTGFTFGTVTNVETINVSLAKQLGTTFTLDASAVNGGDLNLTTAATVEVAGIDVTGSTTAVVNNNRTDIATTGVTDLTVDTNESGGATAISGDASLTTLTVTDANDAGVTITMANDTAVAVNVGGEGAGNDSATVLANNTVTLNNAEGDAIEFLTLGGNSNDVTFDISGNTASDKYTLTGEHDVTLIGDADLFDGATVVDSSTGDSAITLDVAKGGALDMTGVSVDSVKISYASASDDISFNDSQSVTIASDTGTALTFTQGNGNDATLSISLDGGTDNSIALKAIDVEEYSKATIAAGDETISSLAVNGEAAAGDNDTEFVIVGTNDITGTTVNTGTADFTVSGKAVELTTIAANDIELTATDSVTATDVTSADGGSLTVTATNEVSLNNIDLDQTTDPDAGEDLVVSGNEVSIGTIAADDVTLTATNDAAASSTGAITAGNDVSVTDGKFTLASIDAGGTVFMTGDARVTVTSTLAADDGIVVTSSMPTDLGEVDTNVLNAASATNDITATFGDTTNASVVVSTGAANDSVVLNDTAGDGAIFQVQTGAGIDGVTVTSVGAGSVINTGSGNDTVTSTETGVAYTISTGAGSDTITISATDNATVDGGDDSDTLKLADADYKAVDTSWTNIEVIDITAGDATISAAQFANESSFTVVDEDDGGDEILTIAASDGVNTTIDASSVLHDEDRAALLKITGGDGNDTITGSAGANTITTGAGVNTVYGGDGADNITGGADNDTIYGEGDGDTITAGDGVDLVYGGGGDDTINVSGTDEDQNDVIDGGAGTDTINVKADTVFDDVNNNIKNIANITFDDGSDIDLTLTGQTEAFTITGGDGANVIVSGSGSDTITGGDGVDVITGAAGKDTIDGEAGADVIVYTSSGDGAATVTISDVSSADDDFVVADSTADVVTFVVGTDTIKIDGALEALLEADAATGLSSVVNDLDFNAYGIWVIDDTALAGDDFGDIDVLAAAANTGFGTVANKAEGDAIIFTIENNAGTETGIYYWVDVDGSGTINDDDKITLLAVVGDADFTADEIGIG